MWCLGGSMQEWRTKARKTEHLQHAPWGLLARKLMKDVINARR